MQFVSALQTAHDLAYLADLANPRSRVSVFNVDARLRFDTLGSVVVVVGHVAGAVFNEVVVRIETAAFDAGARRCQKLVPARRVAYRDRLP